MIKKLFTSLAMLCAVAMAQVPVTPIVQPHMTFVDAAGNPCAGCRLWTYTAGTTTPFPTYTDSAGVSQNTNPVVLDASGGPATPSGSSGAIWLGRHSYKFILKDALGNTIWTVDNVNAATLFPCGPANTIQISNSGVTGLNCDANIFIDPINHTLNVGTISVNHVTIGALGTPTSWTFDTTTPTTALASLGGVSPVSSGTAGQLGFYAATGSTISGTSAIPSAITATTQTPSDNTTKVATTAYVALPGAIAPSSVQVASGTAMTGNQGAGVKVQHSTGTTTTDNCTKFNAAGDTVDAGISCSSRLSQDLIVTSLCITGTSASATCTTGTATWPVAFADTSYTVVCTPGPVTSGLQGNVYVTNKTTTGFQLIIQSGQNSAAVATTFAEVDCHGSHL